MSVINSIWHFMRADFLERARRNSFFIVLAVTVLLGFFFAPTSDAGYVTFMRAFYRGIYNSAWIGILYGTVCTIFLPFLGFYLVKNTIDRDHQTKVGQIIATTPTSKVVYLLGKWLSNLAVFSVILTVMTVMAIIMQIVRAEDTNIILGQLIPSIWLMSFPVLALAAALAVAFESVPLLRRGMGNLIYFFLWGAFLSRGGMPTFLTTVEPSNDLMSITRPTASIQEAILAFDPDADLGTGGLLAPKEIFGEIFMEEEIKTFVWEGIDWTFAIFLQRMLWLGLPVVITFAAAIPFDRFDPARSKLTRKDTGRLAGLWQKIWGFNQKVTPVIQNQNMAATVITQLTPITTQKTRWRFGGILFAELRLLLKGKSVIWYLGLLGFFVAGLAVPIEYARPYILPFAWLWPIFVWSSMGGREERYFTRQLVYSAAYPLRRQLPAAWFAGVLVAIISVGGVGLQLYFVGETNASLAILIGAFFIPALAMTLGAISGGQRLFEIVYLIWWYLAMNGVAYLGLMGSADEAVIQAGYANLIGLTIVMLIVAAIVKWRKIQQ